MRTAYYIIFLFFAIHAASEAVEFRVLPETVNNIPRGELLTRSLLDEADRALAKRRAAYEKIKTPEDIAAYQTRMKSFFNKQLGEFPQRTPLNPQVTGRVIREGFTVEKIIFESRPRHYVTGALFLPDAKKYPPPYPAVLVVCGHSPNGKAYDGYQRATALLALNGIAGFIIDPVGQGERSQLLDDDGKPIIGGSTTEHSHLGLGAILIGRNTAHYEIWDGMRGIDYLQSRPEVNAERIGCLGNSGGGTQTAYLMALDERIVCAAPSCYITSFEKLLHTIGPQDAEQNIAGQIAFGMNHADYLMMRAPRPTLICCATQDFFDIEGTWDSFRQAKRLYSRLGFAERIDLVENDDKHGFNRPLREAAVEWMVRWLREEDREIQEPDIDILTDEEIQVTPRGQVMLIDGAVSAFDLNRRENDRLAAVRKAFWEKTPRDAALAKVRAVTGIHTRKGMVHGGKTLRVLDSVQRPEYSLDRWTLIPRHGIVLPVIKFNPQENNQRSRWVLVVDPGGIASAAREGGPIEKLLAQGRTVVACDVRGIGTLASNDGVWYNKQFGSEGKNATNAYLLGKSLLGMRAEDIIAVADFAFQIQEDEDFKGIDLIATGALGPPALHAAALEPDLFHSVRLERSIPSFTSLVETPVTNDQWQHIVHGALRVYDLPDLAATLGKRVEWVDE